MNLVPDLPLRCYNCNNEVVVSRDGENGWVVEYVDL